MQRRKKTSPPKDPGGGGESGNGDSEGSGRRRNRRPKRDVTAVTEKPPSCRQQALRGAASNRRQRYAQLVAQRRRLQCLLLLITENQVRGNNLQNEVLTLQDENMQLQIAIYRERKKTEIVWNSMEEDRRPPGMSPPRSVPRPPLPRTVRSHRGGRLGAPTRPFYMDDVVDTDGRRHVPSLLPLIMPYNVNENDILDYEDFEEDLQQYITYQRSWAIENCVNGYSALSSSLLSFGGALEALPPTNAHRFQRQDMHRQRQQRERQQEQRRQPGQRQQEQQSAERPIPRQQHQENQQRQQQEQQENQQREEQLDQQQQRQQQFLLQRQRSLFRRYPRMRRQERSTPARTEDANENGAPEQEQRTGQDRGGQSDDVTDSDRRRESDAANTDYEQLPLD